MRLAQVGVGRAPENAAAPNPRARPAAPASGQPIQSLNGRPEISW
jgi:hypothetical protein